MPTLRARVDVDARPRQAEPSPQHSLPRRLLSWQRHPPALQLARLTLAIPPAYSQRHPLALRLALILAVPLLATLLATPGQGQSPPTRPRDAVLAEVAPELGSTDACRLRMKFEVTFMQIDVANLEARIPADMAARVDAVVARGKRDDDAEAEIAALLLDPAAPILLTMTYLRDADHGRFAKGLRTSMEQAAASGAIDEVTCETLTARFLEVSAPLSDGVVRDAVLAHYIEGDRVRILFLTPDGSVRLDHREEDPALARAIRASWFGSASRFREKLIASLYER